MWKYLLLTGIIWAQNPIEILSNRPITIADIEQYEIECYNDSSISEIHINDFDDRFCFSKYQFGSFFHCINPNHYEWIHREPTFKGFREFIKKKVSE